MKSRRMVAAGSPHSPPQHCCLTGCSGSGGGKDSGATTGTLNFYTDKAAWKPNFDSRSTRRVTERRQHQPEHDRATRMRTSTTRSSSSRSAPRRAPACSRGTPATRSSSSSTRSSSPRPRTSGPRRSPTARPARTSQVLHVRRQAVLRADEHRVLGHVLQQEDLRQARHRRAHDVERADADATKLKASGHHAVLPDEQPLHLPVVPDSWWPAPTPTLYKGLSTGAVKYTDPKIVDDHEHVARRAEEGLVQRRRQHDRPRCRSSSRATSR